MRMHKKASVFFSLLIFVVLLAAVLTIFFSAKSGADLLMKNSKIGEKQFELFKTYQKGENILFYLDDSAKLSLASSTEKLANNGGFIDGGVNVIGSPMWHYKEQDLSPKNYDENVLNIYLNELTRYTSRYDLFSSYFSLNVLDKSNLSIFGVSSSNVEMFPNVNFNFNNELFSENYKTIKDPELFQYSRLRRLPVNKIVLHHTGGDGTAENVISVLKSRHLSIHYIIEQDGTIVATLPENRVAMHAYCSLDDPLCIIPNMNSQTIGIEIINTGKFTDSFDEQYDSVKRLLEDITSRHNILYDDEHIISHYEITKNKWDPAPHFDWAEINLPNHKTQESLGRACPLAAHWGGVCWT